MNWILNRLKEPSTYRGLVWLATALGVSLSPEAWEYITTIGMGAAGLIGVLTSEKATRVDIQLLPIEPVGPAISVPSTTGQSRVSESAHPVADRRDPAGSRMQRVQPDYSPKEPTRPVDLGQSGWNG